MTATGIRKVTMPSGTVAQVKEMAWRNRESASKIIRDIIQEYSENPESFRALPDMEGALSGTITVYVPDDPWWVARDIAYSKGRMPISVVIRKGLRARLEKEAVLAKG
jgi:metal-responsive CopG/Arc/MetJ family transcriptional regulator